MQRKAHICFILHLHVCHYLAPGPLKICYLAVTLKKLHVPVLDHQNNVSIAFEI